MLLCFCQKRKLRNTFFLFSVCANTLLLFTKSVRKTRECDVRCKQSSELYQYIIVYDTVY